MTNSNYQWQDPEADKDRQREERLRRDQKVTMRAALFSLAIVIAPFLALLFSLDFALGVLAAALGFTTWLCWIGSQEVGPAVAGRLRAAAILNGVLGLVVAVILVLRLTSGT